MSHDPGRELVDVIDDAGNVIRTVSRREMRGQRLPHRCTYILVFNSRGELFIHLRTPTKDVYPSHWDVCVGGVLVSGESFDQSARRECLEEIGVAVEPERLFHFPYADDRTIVQGMVYRVVHDGPFVLQASEIVSGEFLPTAIVEDRIGREQFCPDGLAVLARYRLLQKS